MKQGLLHITSILMVSLFLYAGLGFNQYSYCCDTCEDFGSDIFKTVSCDDVHSLHTCDNSTCTHDHSTRPNGANDIALDASDDQCSVTRYTITQLNTSNQSDFTSHLSCITLFKSNHRIAEIQAQITHHQIHRDIPPDYISGRDILLSSSILII